MVHHITEQIPTVMAVGAVSHTTRAVLGKGKKKRATGKSRKFGGKVYIAANWHTTKTIANKDAEYFRKAGHNARVVKEYNPKAKKWGYMVYVR